MSVSAREHISGTTCPILIKFFENAAHDCGLVFLWRRCDAICCVILVVNKFRIEGEKCSILGMYYLGPGLCGPETLVRPDSPIPSTTVGLIILGRTFSLDVRRVCCCGPGGRAGDIDRLLQEHGRSSAATASSVTILADVGS